jgi:Protein of unknown function (DUF3237)
MDMELDRRTALFGIMAASSVISEADAAPSNATAQPEAARLTSPLPQPDRARAPQAVLAYQALALLEQVIPHGRTPLGERFRIPIIGGEFAGPNIKGRILPGGEDWQLLHGDGYLELVANYFMETDDKVLIRVTNRGLFYMPDPKAPPRYAMSTPTFEAPIGKYGWLNQHIFTGTVGEGLKDVPSVRLAIYKMI